jgi:hypothetical protein
MKRSGTVPTVPRFYPEFIREEPDDEEDEDTEEAGVCSGWGTLLGTGKRIKLT